MDVEADVKIKLPENTLIKKHWHKLKFFDSSFGSQEPNEDIVVLDIDQVVVGDMSPILDIPIESHQLASYEKWDVEDLAIKLNGGFYKFKSGTKDYIYQKYISDPEYWQLHYFNTKVVSIPYYGEQNFVQDTIWENNEEIVLVPGKHFGLYMGDLSHYYNRQYNMMWNMKYIHKFKCPYMYIKDMWHPNIRIVHFAHLLNQVELCEELWIKKHWI